MLLMAPKVIGKLFSQTIILTIFVMTLVIAKLLINNRDELVNFIINIINIIVFKIKKNPYLVIAALSSFLILYTNTSKQIYRLTKEGLEYAKYSFSTEEDILEKLGSKQKYKGFDKIVSEKGKNLVIIYCESLETVYMNEKVFPKLMPRINQMKERDFKSYENYSTSYGSGWTIGALYATQTGFPCIFGHGGNDVFNKINSNNMVSYAKVIKKAGYTNLFLSNSDLSFGGTGNLMKILGYDVKGKEDFDVKGVKTAWGVHDYDLFEQAKIEYDKLSKKNKPFNLTMLTVDTHFPKGIPDERMQSFVQVPFNRELEFSVATLDYLLADFYSFIKSQPNAQDTVMIIIGDHPLMGDSMKDKFGKMPRRMVLMTNGYDIAQGKNESIKYYDIPDIVLETAGIKHNAVFPKKMFDEDFEKLVLKNNSAFMHLNLRLNK